MDMDIKTHQLANKSILCTPVEIIDGVNDGDKIVTSGQFLIDSEASMRASLTRMSEPAGEDMSDMQGAEESKVDVGKKVSASGIVKMLMTADRKLNLQHEPVEDLGWPAMTMDFSVAEGVDLSDLAVDDNVMFQLEKRNGSYLITSVHKTDKGGM